MKITVIGGGAMGTACAIVLAEKPDQNVTIWARNPDFAEAMSRDRENARLLPGPCDLLSGSSRWSFRGLLMGLTTNAVCCRPDPAFANWALDGEPRTMLRFT